MFLGKSLISTVDYRHADCVRIIDLNHLGCYRCGLQKQEWLELNWQMKANGARDPWGLFFLNLFVYLQ